MKVARVAWMVVLAGSAAGCGACEPDKTAPPAPSASVSVAPAPLPPPAPPSAHPPRPQSRLACRAITVEGDVHIEPPTGPASAADAGLVPVLLQGLAPTEAWVDLAKGSRLVVKDPRTTRETSFRGLAGPGRARVCVGYAEESWVTAGRFESSVGAGEAPGAEEWVVTPFGVVRYGAARVTVDVLPREAEVKLENGAAFTWTPVAPAPGAGDGGLEDGWMRLTSGTTRLPSRDPAGAAEGARTALDRCKALAASARTLAAQVMSPDGGVDGGTIAAQVTARRLARASCAVATLRVHALPESDSTPLLRALTDANASWSGVPLPPGSGP
jgi:hypothetical protein